MIIFFFLHDEDKLLDTEGKRLLVMIPCHLIAITTETRLLVTKIGEMWILYKA